MNIDDVKEVDEADQHFIAAIFTKQAQLMKKYDGIESANGVHVPEAPWHIDDIAVQLRLKDMFWRITEEFAEACEHLAEVEKILNIPAYECDWKKAWEAHSEIRHFFEEVIDALHFFTEASIIADLPREVIMADFDAYFKLMADETPVFPAPDTIELHCFKVIKMIGLAANCLKNKPWKQSQMPTDEMKFHTFMLTAWSSFFSFWRSLGATDQDLYDIYFKKNAVNQFRQETKY